MKKLFFILGRNPKLSKAEITSYLEARQRIYKEIFFESNILVLEVPDDEKLSIQEFGGIISLGEITFEGQDSDFQEFSSRCELIPADKFSFATFGNKDNQPIKDIFKHEKKRAVVRHGRHQIKFEDGTKAEYPNADFYLLFHTYQNKTYFGLVTQKFDDFAVKTRDMGKPIRREHLAISPRLSKILINLSGAKLGTFLLDPFCGIGGILLEASVKGIKCFGSDNNKEAIEGAKQNMRWLEDKFSVSTKYTVEQRVVSKVPDMQFGAIATETPLGVLLKKKATESQAKKIINDFSAFIIPVLSKLKRCKKPEAKIAITFPIVKDIHANVKEVAKKAGLTIVKGPFQESRPDQFVSRDIIVFS